MDRSDFPLVSCLMVTGNRKQLAKRAIECFRNQSYLNKELVIVDDGDEDLSDLFIDFPANEINYIKLEKKPENVLGFLRNLSIDSAKGEFLVQWDDDDWYHQDRIKIQAECLLEGFDACCLHGTLMHLDDKVYFNLPFSGFLPHGVPGSIMHRVDKSIRYPEIRKAEDTVYLDQWRKKRYKKLDKQYSHLFIRCFHGSNTWESNHFKRRVRNNIKDAIIFAVLSVFNKIDKHPRFRLSKNEQLAFKSYLDLSKRLNLHLFA